MDAPTRELVCQRANGRCEYCGLPQDAAPFFTFHGIDLSAVLGRLSMSDGWIAAYCGIWQVVCGLPEAIFGRGQAIFTTVNTEDMERQDKRRGHPLSRSAAGRRALEQC